MADYSALTREELLAKVADRQKLKEKLKFVHEKLLNTNEVLQLYADVKKELAALQQDQKERANDFQTLHTSHEALEKACEGARDLVKKRERSIGHLEQQLEKAKERADKAERSGKQAVTAMLLHDSESDLADLRKQLADLKKQQTVDHQDVVHLKAQAKQPAQALASDVFKAQLAIDDLQKQLKHSYSARGSNGADSMPSTQDRSGDTNDSRDHTQLLSEVRSMRQELQSCQNKMAKWQYIFDSLGGSNAATAPQGQATSELMQISPTGAEGSNIMPRHAARPEQAEVRRRPRQGSSPPDGVARTMRDVTPHVGSTAGDGGRHDTLGAASDSLSDAVGTSGSLMQPALHQPQPGVRLLPSQPQSRPQGLSSPLNNLHKRPAAEPESAVSPRASSPKRKTIALQQGALIPNNPKKRRRQAPRVDDQQPAEKRVHPSEPQQQQAHQQQANSATHGGLQAYLAKFGIFDSDSTAVDFLELQLARITHSDDVVLPELVSSVAHDICSAWQLRHCPLECIMAAFVASFLECAAAAPSHDLSTPTKPQVGIGTHASVHSLQRQEPESGQPPGSIEEAPMAVLWCSATAHKQNTVSWLLHCVDLLDGLLSTAPELQIRPTGTAQPPAAQPTGKRRGRPPGSKNKKTLLRLEQAGLSLPPPIKHPDPQPGPSQEQGTAVATDKLQQGALLRGLLGQVLHYLGQACEVKMPGPFETEVCCLSATAALLSRATGNLLALRVQVSDMLLRYNLPVHIKLQSIAAALEIWPEALLPLPASSLPAACASNEASKQPELMLSCVHAMMQSMAQQASSDTPTSMPAATMEASVLPSASAQTEEAISAIRDRSKLAFQSWSQNRLAQTAASQLSAAYNQHWQQQLDNGLDAGAAAAACPAQQAGTLWSIAVGCLLREFTLLASETEALSEQRWCELHMALDLMTNQLGWDWAYQHVVDRMMGPMLINLLALASQDNAWALTALGHLLTCMQHMMAVMAREGSMEPTACNQAIQLVTQRLNYAAEGHAQHKGVHSLLSCAALAFQNITISPTAGPLCTPAATLLWPPAASSLQLPEGGKVAELSKYDQVGVELEEI